MTLKDVRRFSLIFPSLVLDLSFSTWFHDGLRKNVDTLLHPNALQACWLQINLNLVFVCRLCSSPWFNFLLQSLKPPRCLNLMKFPKICCTPYIVSAEYRLPSFDYFISESLNIVRMCDKIRCTPFHSFSRIQPPFFWLFHFRVFEHSH